VRGQFQPSAGTAPSHRPLPLGARGGRGRGTSREAWWAKPRCSGRNGATSAGSRRAQSHRRHRVLLQRLGQGLWHEARGTWPWRSRGTVLPGALARGTTQEGTSAALAPPRPRGARVPSAHASEPPAHRGTRSPACVGSLPVAAGVCPHPCPRPAPGG